MVLFLLLLLFCFLKKKNVLGFRLLKLIVEQFFVGKNCFAIDILFQGKKSIFNNWLNGMPSSYLHRGYNVTLYLILLLLCNSLFHYSHTDRFCKIFGICQQWVVGYCGKNFFKMSLKSFRLAMALKAFWHLWITLYW